MRLSSLVARPGLSAVALSAVLWPGSVRGEDFSLRDLDRALAALEAQLGDEQPRSVAPSAAAAPGLPTATLAEAVAELERRDSARRREFAAAGSRRLTGKAAERLERAKAAYEAGHGHLLKVLHDLVGLSPGAEAAGSDPAARRERVRAAREILARIAKASEAEPISTGDLSVRAPRLQPPAAAAGPSSTASAGAAAAPPVGQDISIGTVPAILKRLAAQLDSPVEV
ncbi:MAG: hypothetical protein DMF78_26490 [Acidobacteria bacterium]|nr:MAG: hypothetical protein DMF78_26490 [Acidobacteriota bacterium]